MPQKRNLLCITYRCPPQTYPLAIRVDQILGGLGDSWNVDVITEAKNASIPGATVHHVPEHLSKWLPDLFDKYRLRRLRELLLWPDPFISWIYPAYRKARALLQQKQYHGILVFMMPYSQGLTGVLLKRLTGLPLIMNFDDSLTCSDMSPEFPSYLHYRLARSLEDLYVKSADAVIYVSDHNMKRVRRRQPNEHQDKFHLIRWGSQRIPAASSTRSDDVFQIVYPGGTSGWYDFWEDLHPTPWIKRAFRWLESIGRYELTSLDQRSHGPVYLGQAIRKVVRENPEWTDQIRIDVYGGRLPDGTDERVINAFDLEDIVHLHGPVPHDEVLSIISKSDLLFMALPDRPDGSRGGRISAKTYEYLMSDRPILAALPPGENREYLSGKPGVHLTTPSNIGAMAQIVEDIASKNFAASNRLSVNREELWNTITAASRAEAFESVLVDTIDSQSVLDPSSAGARELPTPTPSVQQPVGVE